MASMHSGVFEYELFLYGRSTENVIVANDKHFNRILFQNRYPKYRYKVIAGFFIYLLFGAHNANIN